MDRFTQKMQEGKEAVKAFAKRQGEKMAVEMTLPEIAKFRGKLEQQMSNTREWEKKPVEERQAIFNEIKAISKLLHKEGIRANMARNFGFTGKSGGKKSKKRSHKKKSHKKKSHKKRSHKKKRH